MIAIYHHQAIIARILKTGGRATATISGEGDKAFSPGVAWRAGGDLTQEDCCKRIRVRSIMLISCLLEISILGV